MKNPYNIYRNSEKICSVDGRTHAMSIVQALLEAIPADYYVVEFQKEVILDTREDMMFRKKTDKEWAFCFGITVEQFLSIEELPEPNWQELNLPCGEDDYQIGMFEQLKYIIYLRKEWGNDPDRCEDFGDYLQRNMVD